MKLILDFDDVLFNSKALKEVMFGVLRDEGMENGEDLYEVERRSGRAFVPRDFLRRACRTQEDEGDTIIEVDVDSMYEKIMGRCPDFVNQELVALVQSVGKENCYIISNGNKEFQEDKVVRANLNTMVTKVIVVPGTKSVEIEQICKEFSNEEIVFVDDKSIYFDDLDREACKNLKAVLYNENGLESLKVELKASRLLEQSRDKEIYMQVPAGIMMR